MITCDSWKFPVTGEQFLLIADEDGNLRANRLLTESESQEYYANIFDRSCYTRRGKTLQGWHRAFRVGRYLLARNSNILDYGCGNGQFLKACRKRFPAAKLFGYEMSSDLCKYVADQSGATVTSDFNELITSVMEGYDLITAWHVLEHCPEPGKVLNRLYSLLKPSGRLIVAVPNRCAIGMSRMGADWAWCQAPFIHIWHFSPKGLLRLAYRAAPHGIAKASTRDAWDCNHLTDWLLHRVFRLNEWDNRRMAMKFDSLFRLFATLPNELLLNPFIFSHRQFGAKLILNLVKPSSGKTITS